MEISSSRRSSRAQRPSHARQARSSHFGDAAGFGDISTASQKGSAGNGTAVVGKWAGGFGDAAGFGDAGGFWIERRAKRR